MLAVSLLLALARPPGLVCDGNQTCLRVRDMVEVARTSNGSKCGTSREQARSALLELGPAAVPYLARALRDERSVARFAAGLLVDLDAYRHVRAWCARTPSMTDICADLRARADALTRLDVVGTWYGTRIDWLSPDIANTTAAIRLRRTDRGLTGDLCDDDHGCVDLDRIDLRGTRLAITYTRPAGPESVVLEVDDDFSGGVLRVAGCPSCYSAYNLWRLRPAP